MKLLGLDSSGLVASAAIVEDDTLLAEYTSNYKKTHSQTLLPMLDEIAGMTELDLDTIDAIAVAAGPGSFTGLRIGSATAKGLGLALNKPLVAVPTVDALAYNLYDVPGLICPLMDARRNQVYTGLYEFRDHKMETVAPQMAVGVEAIVEQINSLGREVIYLGDGVAVYREQLEQLTKVPFSFALRPGISAAAEAAGAAGAVAALGAVYYARGQVETAAEHRPEYLRMSQAERERAEREAKKNHGNH